MTEHSPVFAVAYQDYLDAGWRGILRLPPRAKKAPDSGYTGTDGIVATAPTLARWAAEDPDGNIALRLPRDVIGIDIDAYKDPDVRAKLEAVTGPLPPTWCSTSRLDGSGSGIRFYRVPVPPEGEKWINVPVAAVEICQFEHRYTVVWPSIHPTTGFTYKWIDEASGEVSERVPEVDDLTPLPWAAVEALRVSKHTHERKAPTPFKLTDGTASRLVADRLRKAIEDVDGQPGGRHDATYQNVLALLRYAERGESGVASALEQLRDVFVVAVTPDRQGSMDANREFDGMISHAASVIATTVSTMPTKDERDSELEIVRPSQHAAQMAPTPPAPNDDSDDIGTTWEPVDIVSLWRNGYTPPKPTVCERSEGEGLFYRGRINALNGESGGGKSWVALAACAEQLAQGHRAIYVDMEDHPGSIIARLRSLGVTEEQASRFTYLQPLLPFNAHAREVVGELMEDNDVTIVVIDSVGESMALEQAQQNDDDHVARWFRHIPRALARIPADDGEGPAVVLVDHVPKQNEETKLFAIGSQRKRAAIDGVAYRVDTVVAFSKDKAGKISLTCAKDRNGAYAKNQVVAEVHIDPQEPGLLGVRPPAGRDETGKLTRPTALMERISSFLDEQDDDVSRRAVLQMVSGNDKAKAIALDALVAEGYVTSHQGVFGPKRRPGVGYRSVRRFVDDGGLLALPKTDNAVTRPRRGQDAAMAASSHPNGYRGHAAPLHTSRGPVAALSEEDDRLRLGGVGRVIPTLDPDFDGLI